jgi:hypothetical protein
VLVEGTVNRLAYEWDEGYGTPAPGFPPNGEQTVLRVRMGVPHVTTGAVNVRRQPVDGAVVCILPVGTQITIFEQVGGWGRSELGWSFMKYLWEV